MLSIPYQQLSYIYNNPNNALSNEDKVFIKKYIPNVDKYNRYFADPVKSNGYASDNMSGFLKLYIKNLLKYPDQYFYSFVGNNIGAFYLFDENNSNIYSDSYYGSRQGYLLTDIKSGYDVKLDSKFSLLEKFYERLFTDNLYVRLFPLFIICSLSIYIYIIIYCIIMNFSKNSSRNICSSISIMLLLVTTLFGPCILARYMLPYILCVPILIATYKVKIEN